DTHLHLTYLGMDARMVPIDREKPMTIIMYESSYSLGDVVVTGFYTRDRSSYTGSATTFSGEELKAVSPTSVIEALSTLTPGLMTLEERASGSDPNHLPEIL